MKQFKTYYLMRVGMTTLFGVLLGILFLIARPYATEIFDILLIAMGLMTAVMNLPSFLASLIHVRQRGEWITLVISAVSIVFGILLMLVRRDAILLILGIFSVLLPLVRILLVKERKKRIQRELPTVFLGLFMVFVSLAAFEDTVFTVCGIGAFVISALYLLWGLVTLRFRLAAIAEMEAEQEGRE